jgi:hypothetical protein
MSHIEVLGQHIVVLNSFETAMEMLDNKSTIYSDRPILPVAGELIGWRNIMVLLPYGDRLRRHRKNFHSVIGTRAAMGVYNQVEEIETHRFLKRLLTTPDQLQAHIRQYVSHHCIDTILISIAPLVLSFCASLMVMRRKRTMIHSLNLQTALCTSGRVPPLLAPSWLMLYHSVSHGIQTFAFNGLTMFSGQYPRVVPWCWLQASGPRMARHPRRDGFCTVQIRLGSDGDHDS